MSLDEQSSPTRSKPTVEEIQEDYARRREELIEQLYDKLSASLKGERIPLDVINSQTGEIIVPANCKISVAHLRRMAADHRYIDIDPSPIRDWFRTTIASIPGLSDDYLNQMEAERLHRLRSTEAYGAVRDLQQQAADGDPQSQYVLACDYYRGTPFLKKDIEKAKPLLKSAAENGHLDAQLLLGECYHDEGDYDKAKALYEPVANRGNDEAQFLLSQLSPAHEAISLVRAAALQGHAEALRTLGDFWSQGSSHWWDEHRIRLSDYALCEKVDTEWDMSAQRSVEQDAFDDDDIDEGDRLDLAEKAEAGHCYKLAANGGDADAQRKLGDYYRDGWIELDQPEGYRKRQAVRWYRKAAEQGDDEAQRQLAHCYQHGRGIAQNEELAAKWFKKAEAHVELGELYAQIGDKRAAARAYRKAGLKGGSAHFRSLGPKRTW